MVMRWCAPVAQRFRLVTLLSLCVMGGGLGQSSTVWGAPLWNPPRTNASGDVEDRYYTALTIVQQGTSDVASREQAIASLGLHGLPAEAQAKARQVIQGVSLFRRLPTLQFAVAKEAYTHLLLHPDVAVSSWRAMEISQFELRRTGPNVYHADAKDGSVGTVEVWRHTPEETLIYCDGAFRSPLLTRPIVARAVMRLKTRFFTAADGTPSAEHTGDVLVTFPSQTVETVARLISPVSNMIADRNFKQMTLYAHLMSEAMTRHPAWVESIARRMDVSDEDRQSLLQVTNTVRAAAEQRVVDSLTQTPQPIGPVVLPASAPLATRPVATPR